MEKGSYPAGDVALLPVSSFSPAAKYKVDLQVRLRALRYQAVTRTIASGSEEKDRACSVTLTLFIVGRRFYSADATCAPGLRR
jgi:hypothetical protein